MTYYDNFMIYVFIFVICNMFINIFITTKRMTEHRTHRKCIVADVLKYFPVQNILQQSMSLRDG